ncbi:hypothetical protein [Microseira wollei]|uniref:Uncharacterized protein n=1 Tax=Microseira wollei NIES-4236 TaxID=2530354 RepID=A0AAV3XP30_9CYAN|nr:hypothetical protein [Microseira wollei]GET43408.1 hypothetical protein MiSe_82310 [Microseira wollei NIES-4236]
MFPLEPLFCPCCTPAILHTLAQSDLTRIPQQILWLGKGSVFQAIGRHQQPPRSLVDSIANPIANDALVAARKSK